MRRFFEATGLLIIALLLFAPILTNTHLYAADGCPAGQESNGADACKCSNGLTFNTSGDCVCPNNDAPVDGACKLNPFAQACDGAASSASACQANGNTNPVSGKDGIILRVINIFSFVIGVASVIMVLFGGLRYVVSAGGSEGVKKAKDTILYALIGIVVFLLSRGIIAFVVNKL